MMSGLRTITTVIVTVTTKGCHCHHFSLNSFSTCNSPIKLFDGFLYLLIIAFITSKYSQRKLCIINNIPKKLTDDWSAILFCLPCSNFHECADFWYFATRFSGHCKIWLSQPTQILALLVYFPPLLRWFKFTLKPPYSIVCGKL